MNQIAFLKFLAIAVASLILVSCATAPKVPQMTINIDASLSINPDLNLRPSPVVLYIYYLKSSSIFNGARFVELYSNKQEVLGTDLLGVEEMEVSPGESMSLAQRELPEETRVVGAIAAFRDIDNANWRGFIDIDPGEKFDLNILIDHLTLTVEKR